MGSNGSRPRTTAMKISSATFCKTISRPSFMRYLQLLTKKVERKVEESLPQTFGLVIDGWSEGGTGTHYMAVFAAFQNKDLKPQALLMAFSPLLDETDFSASSQVEFIEFTLGVFKRTLSDVLFITGDNCTTNLKVAKLINVPIIGCASHRFNLSVLEYLEPYSDILEKINNLMKKASTLKRRGYLRQLTNLCPVTRNATRWSSTYSMFSRFFELTDFFNPLDRELTPYLLSPNELFLLEELRNPLTKFQSITKKLQEDHIDVLTVRALFDNVIDEFSGLEHFLGRDIGTLTHYPDFEIGVLNTIEGASLSPEQKKALEKVMNSILVDGIASENEENCSDYAESIIKAKKAKKM